MGEANSKVPHTDEYTERLPALPSTVLQEVFLNLPYQRVIRVCRLVCRDWKAIADSVSLWKERCHREGYQPPDVVKRPRDWQMFYYVSKTRRNLLKNPKAEENFTGWEMVENAGDRWAIEDVSTPLPDDGVRKFFVTSFSLCMKRQVIELAKEGYPSSVMDELQPDIIISDWYAPRRDCGCFYQMCVELLNSRRQVVQKFAPELVHFEQWNDMQWRQMTHVFSNYGPGVRFVSFTHGGRDTQFWAGWYGIRVTNSCVEVSPS